MRLLPWVALGGAVGAMARHGVSMLATSALGTEFPWGTLIVNVLGSFALGATVEWGTHTPTLSEPVRLMVTTGLLGAFTTFSTFSVQTLVLLERGAWGATAANVLANVFLSLAAAALGMGFLRWWAA